MSISTRFLLIILLCFAPTFLWAQTFVEDVEDFLTDMVLLSNRYVSPAADGSVYQSTSSWHSSAKSLNLFEVDVSLHFNALPIPKGQKSFNVSNTEFISLSFQDGSSSANIPTALGGDTETFFDFTIDGEQYELQAFEGVKENVLFHPYIQASVGLWRETEVTLRFSPEIKIDKSSYQIFGGAVKHNLSQYFSKEYNDNQFQLATQIGYSQFNLEIYFDEFVIEPSNPSSGSEPLAVINSFNVEASTWLLQLIASKKINKLEFVGSLGLSINKFNYTMGGREEAFISLFNSALEALEDSEQLFKGDVGVNYHFSKFYISTMFSVGKFANTNVAIHYKI